MNFLKYLFKLVVCRILYRVKFINTDIIKNIDKCIVMPNHVNNYDPVIMYSNIPNLTVLAKKELFKNKLVGKIFELYGVYPIDRDRIDFKSLKLALSLLKSKYSKLLIYPEGTTIRDDKRLKGKIGGVYLAIKSKVPIVPVSIDFESKKLFCKVCVTYHEPIYLDYSKFKDKEYMQKETDKILDDIYQYMD